MATMATGTAKLRKSAKLGIAGKSTSTAKTTARKEVAEKIKTK